MRDNAAAGCEVPVFPLLTLLISLYTLVAGETAVMAAAKGGRLDTLKVLLEAGGDPYATNKDGASCLMLAARRNQLHVVEHLLATTKLTVKDSDTLGRTPLMHAAAGEERRCSGCLDCVSCIRCVVICTHAVLERGGENGVWIARRSCTRLQASSGEAYWRC